MDVDNMAGEAATGYTDDFLDAAVAKLDSLFGRGYAKEHPELVAAYVTASATNLSTFIQSAPCHAALRRVGRSAGLD